MNEYADFPPLGSFKTILQISPHSALLFISLWKNKPKSTRLSVRKKDVKRHFLISPTLFRNHLLAISRVDLLSFEETSEFFLIDFSDQHETT